MRQVCATFGSRRIVLRVSASELCRDEHDSADVLRAQLSIDLGQLRLLLDARCAPRRPEGDQDDLPAKPRQRDLRWPPSDRTAIVGTDGWAPCRIALRTFGQTPTRDGNAGPDECRSNEGKRGAPCDPLAPFPTLLLAADGVQQRAFDLGQCRHDEAPPCERCCLSWCNPRLTRLRATCSVTLRRFASSPYPRSSTNLARTASRCPSGRSSRNATSSWQARRLRSVATHRLRRRDPRARPRARGAAGSR